MTGETQVPTNMSEIRFTTLYESDDQIISIPLGEDFPSDASLTLEPSTNSPATAIYRRGLFSLQLELRHGDLGTYAQVQEVPKLQRWFIDRFATAEFKNAIQAFEWLTTSVSIAHILLRDIQADPNNLNSGITGVLIDLGYGIDERASGIDKYTFIRKLLGFDEALERQKAAINAKYGASYPTTFEYEVK